METNITLEICLGLFPTIIRKPRRKARLLLPEPENNQLPLHIRTVNILVKKLDQSEFPALSRYLNDLLNSLRTLNLLKVIKRNSEVNVRKFGEDELKLNPPIKPGDLVHKSCCLYVLILPGWHRLILWHIRGRLFRAIAFFDDHDKYAIFLDIFYNNFITSR